MKIKWELIIFFSIIFTVAIGVSSYYTLSLFHESVIENELQEMRTLALEKENQIRSLHERASEDLIFAMKNPLFVEYFELPESKAGNVYDENGVMQFTEKQNQIKSELEQWIYHFQNKFDVDETCIIDMSGQEHARLVLSSIESDENLSPDEKLSPFFEASFEKNLDEVHIEFPYLSPDTNRWVFAYTSPIVLGNEEKPAIYHFEMPISIFQDIVDVNHGRMYVIDPQGFLIADSESHYSSTNISEEFSEYFPQVSKIFPDDTFAEIMQNVKTSDQGTISYTGDGGDIYHGVYSKLPTFDWILFYQEDEELMFTEHSTSLGNIQYTISMIIGITFVGTIASIFVISNTITRPLIELQKHTKNIIDGKLDKKIKIKSRNEIGDLAESFNHMTKSLKKTIELEKDLAVANQKIKNEKLTSIGLLASRLAHDIRNPLSVIKLSFDIFKNTLELNEKQQKQISRVDNSISRITHQIDNVLDFVRTQPLGITENSVFETIDSAIQMVDVTQDVKIEKYGDDIIIRCDVKLLEVVFINIIKNAIQAMDKMGTIKISLTDQDDKVMIEIENDGSPIPDDVLPKIFEPLFTTKQTGTGLGLSSCQSIIHQHNGTINAYNNPTRFVIKLPKHQLVSKEISE